VIKYKRTGWARHVALCGRKMVCTAFCWRNMRKSDHLKDPVVDGGIILSWVFKKWDGGMDWIDLAQDRERWRGILNAVTNLPVL
jgi:hypothetical protein